MDKCVKIVKCRSDYDWYKELVGTYHWVTDDGSRFTIRGRPKECYLWYDDVEVVTEQMEMNLS